MKGVAVPYVIAILLGVIVLAVAIYIIYKVVTEGALECEECRAKFTGWCSTCYLANSADPANWQNEGSELGDELYECVKTKCNIWSNPSGANQKCNSNNAQDACKNVGVPP